MLAAISYGEIACGLHEHDIDHLSINPDRTYSYYFDSPIIVPAPQIHNLNYFPHRVLVLGTKCASCLRSRTDCPGSLTRSSTPRGVASAPIRRSNTHPRSKPPYSVRRPKHHPKMQRSRSLTDIHSSSALAPSPLCNCAAYDEAGVPVPVSARVGPVYEPLEAVPRPGMHTSQSMIYPTTTPYSIQTPSTARQGYLQTPLMITMHALHSPVVTPVTSIMVTPVSASTISLVSPIRARFGFPMTYALPIAVFGEGAGFARDPEMEVEDDIEDADVRTEVGLPEIGEEEESRLPPIRTLPPIQSYSESVVEQTRRAMQGGGAVLRDVVLYGPAGVTPAPAELTRNNVCNKLPPVPSHVPPHQATFFGIQSVPVADSSGRFATICVPPRAGVPIPVSTRPVYPPAGITPLIAGHQGLPHGGLTAPIKRGDEVAKWKEQQHTKERVHIVVKDGELSQAEKLEMENHVCEWELVRGWQVYTCGIARTVPARGLVLWGKAEMDCGPGAACVATCSDP
ncbi:hypothetical protein FRC08_001264 [Ceratobasidium sp. 394]|nr:hypothetical protein FRC08_001264 [Ceratobasidium sp. 394]